MSEFIDVISPSALADIEAVNAKIVKTIELSKEANKNLIGAKSPSSSDSAIKSLNAELLKLQKLYADLQKELLQVSTTKKQINQQTAQEVVNQGILNQNAKRQVLVNSQLAGAYRNLSAQVSIASERYQNLIVRGKLAEQTQRQYNRELRQAQLEFRNLQSKVLQADKAVDKWNRTGERSIGFAKNLMGAFGVIGGVTLFATISRDIFNTAKELQGLNNALMLVTDNQSNFAEQQQFLQRISEAYGLELMGLTKQFTQFYVSAKDKLSGKEIQGIFESISKAGASMGLSVESQERAFLALNQMMSKGTIQAEELRGQLGEALPGAFGIMAKAVGVTEQELSKMMKAGELLASEVLPKFAKQLEITYGIENINRIETMTTAQNRLSNAWTNFVATISASDGVLTKFLTKTIGSLAKVMDGLRLMTMTEKERNTEMQKQVVEKRVKEYQDYIETLDLTNKAVVRNLQIVAKADIERAIGIRKEVESLEERNKVLEKYGIGGTAEIRENNKKINSLKVLYEQYLRQSEVLDDTIDLANKQTKTIIKNTDATDDNTKATKANNDEKKKEVEYLEGSVEWFEKQISELKEVQKQTAISSEEWKFFDDVIKDLQNSIDIITGKAEVLGTTFQEAIKKVDFSKVLSAGVSNASKGIEDMGEGWEKTFVEWSQVALDAINTVQQAQQQANERELYNLEKQRDTAILFAGESADARAEVDRQYDEKRRALLNRQAKQDKALAITQAIINTAGAVIAGLKTSIPYAIAVGVIGAAQIALIASQQIPQFYKGTDNAPEGLAWTQEKGAELITDKKGNIKSYGSNKGAQMTYLNKGDKVFTAKETKDIMFNNELNGILTNNGISNSIVNNNVDLSPLRSDINNLTNVIKNKSEVTFVRDIQGERVYKREQGQKKVLVSNRLRIKP